MKSDFLPQSLNKSVAAACVAVEIGASSTDMHWHDCAEMIHMKKGEALLFLGEKWHTVRPGETVFIPVGQIHCCHCEDKTAHRIVVGLHEELLPRTESGDAALCPFHSDADSMRCIFDSESTLPELFSSIEEKEAPGVAAELERLIKIGQIYTEMLKIWERDGHLGEMAERCDTVKRVLRIISERSCEPLCAEKVAQELNVSYSYMAALLKRELSQSFGELLLSERIVNAKRLLLTTDRSITYVGLDCGFTDSSYFIKKFRAATGTTPHRYRKENLRRLSVG